MLGYTTVPEHVVVVVGDEVVPVLTVVVVVGQLGVPFLSFQVGFPGCPGSQGSPCSRSLQLWMY